MRTDIPPTRQYQLRLYDSKVRRLTQHTDPPLRTRQRRRVNLELFSFGDVRRCRLELCDVRAVSELCLEVSADDGAGFY